MVQSFLSIQYFNFLIFLEGKFPYLHSAYNIFCVTQGLCLFSGFFTVKVAGFEPWLTASEQYLAFSCTITCIIIVFYFKKIFILYFLPSLRLGEIPGISALTQAMISGAKNHQNNLADIERTEREALEAMKTKEFPKVD